MKKRDYIFKFIFCLGAVLLNLIGAWCTRFFALPLYLDSISTIAVAYLFGLAPSLAVAAVTNVILLFACESPLVFTVCHLLTAAGAWAVFRFFKKPTIDLFLLAGLSLCLLYIMNNLPFALFASGIATNLADKILSAMFSYLLVVSIKKRRREFDMVKSVPSNSYFVTSLLIFIAVANIVSCFVFQKAYRKISGAAPSLDSSLYLLILTSIVLLAASFMIVYAKMIQIQKEKELEEHRRELSKRMSFDLHDGVLQNLVALKARMESELYQNKKSPEIQLLQTAVSEIRILCGILRLNDEVPLEESIQNTLFSYEQTYGFKTKLGIACDISLFTQNQKAELLHILYECLSNSAQHSNAKNVSVTFADDGAGKIFFTVRDDGKTEKRSLDYARDDSSAWDDSSTRDDSSAWNGECHPELVSGSLEGLGLKSIETRVKNLGGTVQFLQNEDGWTTRMELQIG